MIRGVMLVTAGFVAGCGPQMVETWQVDAPAKKPTPPKVSPEEISGQVPTIRPLEVPKIAPDGFKAPPPPPDPNPPL